MKRQKGFTLVELLVVVTVIGLLLVVLSGIMIDGMRAKLRSQVTQRMNRNWSFIFGELKSNLWTAERGSLVCTANTISFVNSNDGQTTTISCDVAEKRIASTSGARVVPLSDNTIKIEGCSSFISCEKDAEDEFSKVNFNLVMKSGEITQPFSTSVSLRE